jgi:hypothetical protein
MRAAWIALSCLLAIEGALAHDHWINRGRYTNQKTGELCCGLDDCFMIAADHVKATPAGYLLTSGELIPFDETQRSEDDHFWRCQRYDRVKSRRCFFAPEPAS